MSNTKHLNLKDFEKSEIIGQVYAPSLMKGRGKEKLIGELDKAGKNVKTANGWVPVKGNEHLITGEHKKQSLKEKVIQILGDISANNRREKRLIQENIDKVYDNFDKKEDYVAALRLIYDFEANDQGKSVKREALNNIASEIENHIKKPAPNLAPTVAETKHAEVHPDIKEAIDNYNGGIIRREILIHLSAKYADKQPIETFSSAHGAPIKVYGKEGNNYAINFGVARGIVLATPADMNTLRGKKKEVVTEIDEKQNKMTNKKPTFQLSGTDGNVFAIISKVSDALKRAGQADNAKEFMARAFKAGSYDEVLQMVREYVNAK